MILENKKEAIKLIDRSDVSLLMKIFNTFIQRNLSDIEYKRLIQLGWVKTVE